MYYLHHKPKTQWYVGSFTFTSLLLSNVSHIHRHDISIISLVLSPVPVILPAHSFYQFPQESKTTVLCQLYHTSKTMATVVSVVSYARSHAGVSVEPDLYNHAAVSVEPHLYNNAVVSVEPHLYNHVVVSVEPHLYKHAVVLVETHLYNHAVVS